MSSATESAPHIWHPTPNDLVTETSVQLQRGRPCLLPEGSNKARGERGARTERQKFATRHTCSGAARDTTSPPVGPGRTHTAPLQTSTTHTSHPRFSQHTPSDGPYCTVYSNSSSRREQQKNANHQKPRFFNFRTRWFMAMPCLPHLPLEEAVRAELARHGHRDGLGDVRPGPEDRDAHHLHRCVSFLFALNFLTSDFPQSLLSPLVEI